MKQIATILSLFVVLQLCKCAVVENAENKLKELREITSRKIDETYNEHQRSTNEIEEIALFTKQRGLEDIARKTKHFHDKLTFDRSVSYRCRNARDNLYEEIKKQHSDELIRCVDHETRDSFSTLVTQNQALVDYVWNAIFEEEKHIVACGRNSNCLDAVIDRTGDKMFEAGQVVNGEIQLGRHSKNERLEAIRACGRRVATSLENALGNVPTCNF